MRHLILTLLFLISAANCGRAINDVSDHLDISDGLSNNFVTDIVQDSYGYLWIGTDNGLNRFDGERFTVFSEKDKSLRGNSVNTLYYDDIAGHLWVGSKKGIDVIDCRTLESVALNIPEELRVQSMAGFAPDGKDGIYILAQYSYIGYYDRGADSCRIYREPDLQRLIMSMQAAASNTDGRLIAGQENYGLSLVDLRNKTFENFMHDPLNDRSLPGNNVNAVLVSRDGDLIAATDHGVCRFDRESNSFESVAATDTRGNDPGKGNIISIAELSDGTILASGSEVLFQDTYGNIWIGTAGNGLEFIPANPPLFGKVSSHRVIPGALMSNKNGSAAAARADIGNEVLESVAGDGIFLVDKKTCKVSQIATPYEKDYANTILPLTDGRALLGTQHGLYEYYNGKIERREKLSAATGWLVPNGLATDRRGRLWVGTYGNGVFVFDKDDNVVTHLTSREGLASNAVKQLLIDSRQWMWVAGQDGVSVIKDINHPEKIKSFTYENGLADISIRSMTEDREGNIWLASNNILSRYNAQGDSIESFGSRFKVTKSSFTDRAAATGPDGRIYFGALDGVYSFLPEAFDRRKIDVPVRIAGYSILPDRNDRADNTAIHYNPGQEIRLPHRCKGIRILVAIPDFSLHGRVSYSYKVEGLSDEWLTLPDSHEIVLHDLEGGSYTLKIRTDEVYGHRAGEGTAGVKITVARRWWLMWWAVAAYVLLGSGLVFIIIKFAWTRRRSGGVIPEPVMEAPVAIAQEEKAPEEKTATGMSRVDKEFLDHFTSLLEKNIERADLDMEFFQAELNMSHSTLYRRLKNLTGMSGNELIKKYRLKKGHEMLLQGFSVSETAYACGFSDPGYFRACFKNEYGKAPSEMKNSGN